MLIIDEEYIDESVLLNLFMVYQAKIDRMVSASEEYKDKQKILVELEEKYREKLTKEEELSFEEIINNLNYINFTVNKGYFTEGFIQGVKLMQEINSKNNDK